MFMLVWFLLNGDVYAHVAKSSLLAKFHWLKTLFLLPAEKDKTKTKTLGNKYM